MRDRGLVAQLERERELRVLSDRLLQLRQRGVGRCGLVARPGQAEQGLLLHLRVSRGGGGGLVGLDGGGALPGRHLQARQPHLGVTDARALGPGGDQLLVCGHGRLGLGHQFTADAEPVQRLVRPLAPGGGSLLIDRCGLCIALEVEQAVGAAQAGFGGGGAARVLRGHGLEGLQRRRIVLLVELGIRQALLGHGHERGLRVLRDDLLVGGHRRRDVLLGPLRLADQVVAFSGHGALGELLGDLLQDRQGLVGLVQSQIGPAKGVARVRALLVAELAGEGLLVGGDGRLVLLLVAVALALPVGRVAREIIGGELPQEGAVRLRGAGVLLELEAGVAEPHQPRLRLRGGGELLGQALEVRLGIRVPGVAVEALAGAEQRQGQVGVVGVGLDEGDELFGGKGVVLLGVEALSESEVLLGLVAGLGIGEGRHCGPQSDCQQGPPAQPGIGHVQTSLFSV